jgi:arginyl-tRNA--protein-N-Asp/Glu arginylyltransferase
MRGRFDSRPREMELPPLIIEDVLRPAVSPEMLDELLAAGWRHFGCQFFRYSISIDENGALQRIMPLRLDLAEFQPSKSQRRVLRRNADLTVRVAPATVDEQREAMFQRHKARFKSNVPDSLRDFLPETETSCVPCECREVQMWEDDRLLAVSYLDVGREAVSSVYAMFEPEAARRSPGIFTLLQEIELARTLGRRFLYPGYATVEPGHYDYKKQFRALHWFDWQGNWHPLHTCGASDGS